MKPYIISAFLIIQTFAVMRPALAYTAMGSGTSSCGQWQADRRNTTSVNSLIKQAWVVGFLSGVGYIGASGDNPLDGTDLEGVTAWIDNYCTSHPLEMIAGAAAAFTKAHPHRK